MYSSSTTTHDIALPGTIWIEPSDPVPALTNGTWMFRYRCAAGGMAVGGAVRIHFFDSWGHAWDEDPINLWTLWQAAHPRGAGFLTARVRSDGRAAIRLHVQGRKSRKEDGSPSLLRQCAYMLEVRVEDAPLRQGEEIEIVWGDTSRGGTGTTAPIIARRYNFFTAVDAKGDGSFEYLDNYPYLEVTGQQATRLVIAAPSTIVVGEEFTLGISPVDDHGNLDSRYGGTIQIETSDGRSSLHSPRLRLALSKAGLARIGATDGAIKGGSNPIRVLDHEPQYRVFWGDIHAHTIFSDGCGTVEEWYEHARDVARLDFCAVTDHNQHTIPLTQDTWRRTCQITDRYHEPGRFITLVGHECQMAPDGHANIYYDVECAADAETTIDPTALPTAPLEIRDAIRPLRGILIPHHSSHWGMGWDWRSCAFDPAFMPLVEVYSSFGASEYRGNPYPLIFRDDQQYGYVQDALAHGLDFGFVGGTDGHEVPLGCSIDLRRYPRSDRIVALTYKGGWTAVLAKQLTRRAIWEALAARRCYATTGARILLEFSINGNVMGSVLRPSSEVDLTTRRLCVYAAGTSQIERVEIVKNNQTLVCFKPTVQPSPDAPSESAPPKLSYYEGGSHWYQLDIRSGDDPVWFEFCDKTEQTRRDWYYVRVTQVDGEMAWSSPIFIYTVGESSVKNNERTY